MTKTSNHIPSARHSDHLFDDTHLVGREDELGELRAVITGVLDGKDGTMVLLHGEAGIGKTRLVKELGADSSRRGVRWLYARCSRDDAGGAYSVWIDLIRGFADEAPANLFFRVAGNHLEDIIELLPDYRGEGRNAIEFQAQARLFGNPNPQFTLQEKQRFYTSLKQFFVRLSRESPLLIILDDLQWADNASLQFLRFVAEALRDQRHPSEKARIVFVGAYRDSGPGEERNESLSEFILDVSHDRLLNLMELGRLDEAKVTTLIENILRSRTLAKALGKKLFAKSGGNPLFLLEYVRSLEEQGVLRQSYEGIWELSPVSRLPTPGSIRSIVGSRLRRLDEGTLQVLRVASVIGDSFNLELIREASGLEWKDAPAYRLFPALDSGLIEERRTGPRPIYSFTDEFVRDAIYEGIEDPDRKRIHLDVAQAIEKVHSRDGGNIEGWYSALAQHFLQGEDLSRALDYSIKAGDRATKLFAHEEALEHFRMALELIARQQDRMRNLLLKAELDEKAGDEAWSLVKSDLAAKHWEDSCVEFGTAGLRRRAAEQLYKIGDRAYYEGLHAPEKVLEVMQRGATLLEGEPPCPEMALLNVLAIEALEGTNNHQKASELAEQTLVLSQKVGAHEAESMCYAHLATDVPYSEKGRGEANALKALEVALANGCIVAAFNAFCYLGSLYHTTGEFHKQREVWTRGIRFMKERGYEGSAAHLRIRLATYLHVPLGEWDEARKIASELVPPDGESSTLVYPANYTFNKDFLDDLLGVIALVSGRFDEAVSHLSHNVEGPYSTYSDHRTAFIARALIEKGELDSAESLLRKACAEHKSIVKQRGLRISNSMPYLVALTLLLEVNAKQGRREEARGFLAEAWEVAKAVKDDWAMAFAYRAQALVLANELSTNSAYEESAASFANSLVYWTKIEWPYEGARTLFELGSLHLRYGKYELGNRILKQALKEFTRLGASSDALKVRQARHGIWRERNGIVPSSLVSPAFENESSKLVYQHLVDVFLHDYHSDRLPIENCGWRTLNQVAKSTKISRFQLYGRNGGSGAVLKELARKQAIEVRLFRGERGRGGEVTRIRVRKGRQEMGTRQLVDGVLPHNSSINPLPVDVLKHGVTTDA